LSLQQSNLLLHIIVLGVTVLRSPIIDLILIIPPTDVPSRDRAVVVISFVGASVSGVDVPCAVVATDAPASTAATASISGSDVGTCPILVERHIVYNLWSGGFWGVVAP
jgi:hypothetical protein